MCLMSRWGTVENVPAGPRREERKCNPRNTLPPLVPMNRRKRLFHMVFTTIGEPQAHDDRLLTCGGLGANLLDRRQGALVRSYRNIRYKLL
jgi:hypothetical protein